MNHYRDISHDSDKFINLVYFEYEFISQDDMLFINAKKIKCPVLVWLDKEFPGNYSYLFNPLRNVRPFLMAIYLYFLESCRFFM